MIYFLPLALLVLVGVLAIANIQRIKSINLGPTGLTLTFYKTNSTKNITKINNHHTYIYDILIPDIIEITVLHCNPLHVLISGI